MSLSKLQKLLFYAIIFLIPCNLAKHWPQNWSYVHGILVDYLIPTLYLTDVLILILLGVWAIDFLKSRINKYQISNIKKNQILLFILLFSIYTLYSILYTKNPYAAIYKLIKLAEMGLFILWIKHKGSSLQRIILYRVICLSVIWQSVLAITQWFKQGSVFGYWFFGEQPYTSATLAIKKISLSGVIKVLPMGTFPHPNILAGFLVVSLLFVLLFRCARGSVIVKQIKIKSLISKKGSLILRIESRVLEIIAMFLGIIALGLTFSLPAWAALLVVSGCLPAHAELLQAGWLARLAARQVVGKTVLGGKLKYLFYSLLFTVCCLLLFYGLKTLEVSSITRRQELTRIAFKMWQSSPVFGVGLNNFIPRMEEFGRIIASYRFLQPVHNIYLLILSELGILGLLGTLGVLWIIIKKLWKKRKEKYIVSLFHCFIVIFFLGLFDHYFLTIQQGMLVVSMVLGLSFASFWKEQGD